MALRDSPGGLLDDGVIGAAEARLVVAEGVEGVLAAVAAHATVPHAAEGQLIA